MPGTRQVLLVQARLGTEGEYTPGQAPPLGAHSVKCPVRPDTRVVLDAARALPVGVIYFELNAQAKAALAQLKKDESPPPSRCELPAPVHERRAP